MKRNAWKNILKLTLAIIVVLTSLIPITGASAAAQIPASFEAPQNFAASNYMGRSVVCTLSAPEDLRALKAMPEKDRGYFMGIEAQVDFKVDSGDWHYSADWDNPSTYKKFAVNYNNAIIAGVDGRFLGASRYDFATMVPKDANVPVPAAFTSWDWYKKHAMTLRARFAVTCGKTVVFSPWSEEYVLSNAGKMDYKKIMNENAPKLISSKIEVKGVTKVPWVALQLDRHPAATQKFNAASSNSMWTEVWLRKQGDKDFVKVGQAAFANEIVWLNVSSYFKGTPATNYEAMGYEVKVRYTIDERAYQQSNQTKMTMLTSPYSNTLAYNMPAWSAASKWASAELQKADDLGLIPDSLKGADLTKPVTRAEFAAISVKLYEQLAGKKLTPSAKNPFKDTKNVEVLKAFGAGIAVGVSSDKFQPDTLVTREESATMLVRVLKKVKIPNWTFAMDSKIKLDFKMPPKASDDAKIANWAKESVYFMIANGIITSTADNAFAPQKAASGKDAVAYTSATREQALVLSLRFVEKLDDKDLSYTQAK